MFPKLKYSSLSNCRSNRLIAFLNCALIALLIALILNPFFEARVPPACLVAFFTIVGGLIGISPIRPLFYIGVSLVVALYSLISLTPLVRSISPYFIASDDLPQSADAIVTLSAEWPLQNRIKSQGLERLIHARELMQQGLAPLLVLTEQPLFKGNPHQDQAELLGQFEKQTIRIGPVENTYEEAKAFNQLAIQKNWSKIILVTSALHSGRAKAIFIEQNPGIEIISSPAKPREFDLETLITSYEKLKAARLMLYEVASWGKNLILGRL